MFLGGARESCGYAETEYEMDYGESMGWWIDVREFCALWEYVCERHGCEWKEEIYACMHEKTPYFILYTQQNHPVFGK